MIPATLRMPLWFLAALAAAVLNAGCGGGGSGGGSCEPVAEVCNGLDDDCDGEVDEGDPDGGSGPYTGAWWAWFGGAVDEDASVIQTLVLPVGGDTLRFMMEIPACAASGADGFQITVDGTEVYRTDRTDPRRGLAGYEVRSVDISAFADGATHTVEIHGWSGGAGVTYFFVDEVGLVCN